MTVLLKRTRRVRALVGGTLLIFCAKTHAAATPTELVDIASRIDYGFYAADPRTLEAAQGTLRQRSSKHAAETYYSAYAAYRLSQLPGQSTPRQFRKLIGECIRAARSVTTDPEWSIEAWILLAACSIEGRKRDHSRALNHELRLTEALRAARTLDPTHPRVLLVDAWAQRGQYGAVDLLDHGYQTQLEQVRARFESWGGTGIGFDWGRAEVLTELATMHAANEHRREARDLIEQALIEAPDYHVALSLKNELL